MDFSRFTEHASDPIFQHLRVNHFPIVLGLLGFVATILALIIRKDAVWRYAAITTLLAGAAAPVAFWTGKRAEDKANAMGAIDPKSMAQHAESADLALWLLLASGAFSVAVLVRQNTLTRSLLLVSSLAATGATAYTAAIAGNIVHGEWTMSLGDK